MLKKSFRLFATFVLLAGLLWVPVAAERAPGQVIDDLFEAYAAGSVQGMLAVYSEDAVFEDVSQRHKAIGTEELRAMLLQIVTMHKQMDIAEKRRLVEGNSVVVEYEYVGQLNGAVLAKSVGKEACPDLHYRLPVTSWYRIENGKLVSQKDFIDFATYLDLKKQMATASH